MSIKDYVTITETLVELTRKNTRFTWTQKLQPACDKLTPASLNSPVVSYFDTSKETCIFVDSRPVGLSAMITQKKLIMSLHTHVVPSSLLKNDIHRRESKPWRSSGGIENFHLYVFWAPSP